MTETTGQTPDQAATATENETKPAAADITLGQETPVEEVEQAHTHQVPKGGTFWGLGRRKASIARVRIMPGSGKYVINKKEMNVYFPVNVDQNASIAPLQAVEAMGKYDVYVNVKGGGRTGQSGAVLLGLARALAKADPKSEGELRHAGYMTRDSRRVERKKYGQRKARRRFQFSKR